MGRARSRAGAYDSSRPKGHHDPVRRSATRDRSPAVPDDALLPVQPPAQYAELRENEPISRAQLKVNGKPAWLVTRHDHIKKVLGDSRVSSNLKLPGYPLQVPVPDEILQSVPLTFVSMDPGPHRAAPDAGPGVQPAPDARAARPDPADRGQADRRDAGRGRSGGPGLRARAARPSWSSPNCWASRTRTTSSSRRAAQIMNHNISEEERGLAHYELDQYVGRLVTAKETEPGDDMLSRLVELNRAEPTVEYSDIVSMGKIMLVTGHETTANMIALGTLALLEHPSSWRRSGGPVAAAARVEELLRFFSISDAGTARVALEDIEIDGTVIPAGEGILPLNNSANHDENVFPDPEARHPPRVRSHLAFGYGVHQCIGQNLARLELEVVYGTLFRRIPELRLATPMNELKFKDDAVVYGIYEMPVTW
ncbi:cytochrome P450 [Streptomyces sp. M19]